MPALSPYGCAHVLVSWDGDGLFTGPFDEVTPDVPGDPGVSIDGGRDGARQLSPPKVLSTDFVLRNDDGTYSQEHAGSPVYQRVIPGRPVLVTMDHGETDAYDTPARYTEADYYDGAGTYALARTVIDDISQETGLGDQAVTLRTLGVETLLVGTTVTVAVMANPRVDECVTAILDAVGWPVSARAISVADTRLLWWWCDDRTPWDALLELLASEGPGALYVTAENGGTIHFENRNYRIVAERSTTSQAAFFDRRSYGGQAAYDEPAPYDEPYAYDGEADVLYFTALSYDPGFRNIFNAARFTTRRRQLAATPAVIWQYGADLRPTANGTTLIIRPSDPFQGAIVPVAGTDYAVAGGTVSMSLSAPSGLVAFLTVTATGGSPLVTGPAASPTTGLQLRAQPLAVVGETTVTNLIDASKSIALFSPIPGANIPRVFQINGWPEMDAVVGQAVCDAWIARYMEQRPAVTIEVRNADGPHLRQILRLQVSDRVSILERNSGLSADLWVNSKAVTIAGAGGRDVRAVLGLEKVDEVRGGVWDFSYWDEDDDAPGHPAARWGV